MRRGDLMKKIATLLLILGMLVTPITAAVTPLYDMAVTQTYWTNEEQLSVDFDQDGTRSEDPILVIEGDLVGVVNPTYDKFSVSTTGTLYVSLSSSHYKLYVTGYTPVEDTVLTVEYKDTTVTPQINLAKQVPVQTYKVTTNTSTSVHSGAFVSVTGTVVPLFEQTGYNVFVWRNGTKIVQVPVTNGTFTATFTAYGPIDTEYVLSIQPATDTSYNQVPYHKWTVTSPANITLSVAPSVVPTGTVSALRVKAVYADQPLVNHQITGEIKFGTATVPFSGTTNSNGQIAISNIAFNTIGLAQITATVSKSDGVYGVGHATLEITNDSALSIDLVAPDFVIGSPNTIQVVSMRNGWTIETATITVTGAVVETGTVLHNTNFTVTPVGAGTIKLNVVATLKNGDQKETVERNFSYDIDGYIAKVTPETLARNATTDITVQVTTPDGNPVNNAVVMFVSPTNTTTISIDGRTATGINNGTYKLTVPSMNNADKNSYVKVLSGSEVMSYIPVPIAKSQSISIKLEPSEVNIGQAIPVKVTLTSSEALGNVIFTVDKLLTYNIVTSSTQWTGTLVVTPTRTGEYKVTAESTQAIGTATLVVKEPVVSVTPTSLLVNTTATINIVSNGMIDITSNLTIIDKQVTSTNAFVVVKPANAGTATIEIIYNSGFRHSLTIPVKKPAIAPIVATITTDEFIVTASTDLPANTQVVVTVLGQSYTVLTDAQGMIMFILPSKLPVGTYNGIVVAEGYEQTTLTLHVTPSKLPNLLYTVSPTSVVVGEENTLVFILTNADKQPIPQGTLGALTVGNTSYNFVVGQNGSAIVRFTLPEDTQFPLIAKLGVAGYSEVVLTLSESHVIRPQTTIRLSVGMDVYTINGETKFWDAAPYVKNGRTMVPVRYLAEAVGFDVDYDFSDPNNRVVMIYMPDDHEVPYILFVIGQPIAMYKGQLIALDIAPEILNDRTMVPLRFVVESLGYKVNWQPPAIELTYP